VVSKKLNGKRNWIIAALIICALAATVFAFWPDSLWDISNAREGSDRALRFTVSLITDY
jgi:hypothetical protein